MVRNPCSSDLPTNWASAIATVLMEFGEKKTSARHVMFLISVLQLRNTFPRWNMKTQEMRPTAVRNLTSRAWGFQSTLDSTILFSMGFARSTEAWNGRYGSCSRSCENFQDFISASTESRKTNSSEFRICLQSQSLMRSQERDFHVVACPITETIDPPSFVFTYHFCRIVASSVFRQSTN